MVASTSAGDPARRRHVRLTDRRLVEMAVQTASGAAWPQDADTAADTAQTASSGGSECPEVEIACLGDDVSPCERRGGAVVVKEGARTVVTASVCIAGSVAEVRSVLRPATSRAFAATMRELYGSDFIYGAIVHAVGDGGDTTVSAKHPIRQQRAGAVVTTLTSDVDVRTITFGKRHLLARSEQWCFVDALHSLKVGRSGGESLAEGFATSMTSLHPDDVFLGKTKASVSAYTDVRVVYTVLPDDDGGGGNGGGDGDAQRRARASRPRSRVSFRAEFDSENLSAAKPRHLLSTKESVHFWRSASESALLRRLKDMAGNTRLLDRILRRRRISAQVLVDMDAMVQPNSRCSCCTRLLTSFLGRAKTRCHLCGFYVCEECSQQEEVERGLVRNFVVRICDHCLERVDDCVYDNLPSDIVSSPTIVPDDPGSKCHALGELLRDALLRSSDEQRPVVKSIIRAAAALDTPLTSPCSSDEGLGDDEYSDEEYLDALDRLEDDETDAHVDADADASSSSFALSNSHARSYPLRYKPGASAESLPDAPVPADEEQRLQWLARTDVAKLKNLPELELICDMAHKELRCSSALVTVATREELHVLASNAPASKNFVNSRENALCAHVLMDPARPLLLLRPEADVRFTRQSAVRDQGTRFYFGFPLSAADGTAIGAVCCLDSRPHDISQSQYRIMERFARSASRVIQQRAATAGRPGD